jgi:cobyrinic acid a,c-diamide synthase
VSAIPTVVVAAAQSGAGKTTATLALIAGLRRRGLRVQPFKVGPDYLDPSLLGWAAGRPCRNLDGWMVPGPHLLELFHRACEGADMAVVEGVMGLFDGRVGPQGDADEASTAAIARLLDAPVVLVLDAQRAARTVGAVALGLARADPALSIAGAVLNRVASDRHRDACREGLLSAGVQDLGHIARDPRLTLPDRYLGLISALEAEPGRRLRRLLERAASELDLQAILGRARLAPRPRLDISLFPTQPQPVRARIAVAQDRAFHFYYQDSIDLLQAWGAELVLFSPLESSSLPPKSSGVYLGGGYPELFAVDLAANEGLRRSLRTAYRRGALVYAECGGAMYAGAGIEDAEGNRHRMLGLWPAWASLKQRRLTVGYRQIRACSPGFLSPRELRAHEFHYSRLRRPLRQQSPAWLVLDDGGRTEGHAATRLTASYMHLHLGSQPGLAAAFVQACECPS